MPGDCIPKSTDMPKQLVVVEAYQSTQWPPTLASIKDKSVKIINTTNQPVLINYKDVHLLDLCQQ